MFQHPEMVVLPFDLGDGMKISRDRFLKEYAAAIRNNDAAVFVGAGVSMSAGYPSWIGLMKEIGEELGVQSKDVHDLAALAQWSLNANKGDQRVKDVINQLISPPKDTPAEAEVLARLPIKNLWTTNYDQVIERAFHEIGRPIQPIANPKDLGRKPVEGSARLYKMHGSVTSLDDLVISTEDYELFDTDRGAYLPLLQSHLTTSSMLFIGVSFVDPNIRHVLSVIRSRFKGSGREHYAIIRPPQIDDFESEAEHQARLRQHELWADDLHRYGLRVVEIDDFDEIKNLLEQLEREVAKSRIWVSGSWTLGTGDEKSVVSLSHAIGSDIAKRNYSLVTGYGLVVGSATLAGFMDGLRDSGHWGVSERLFARPFPQPEQTKIDHQEQWRLLRTEMAQLAGAIVVVGGTKHNHEGSVIVADGVLKEVEIGLERGKLIIPIGSTGGAAEKVAQQLIKMETHDSNGNRLRPDDADIEYLMRNDLSENEMVKKIFRIIEG